MDSLLLAMDYIQWSLLQENILWSICLEEMPKPNAARLAMRKLGGNFHKIYNRDLIHMVEALKLTRNSVCSSFKHVCDKYTLLDTGNNISWNRIVAFYAFSSAFTIYCARHGMYHMIHDIIKWIAIFTCVRYSHWVAKHGGWASLAILEHK